MHIMSARDAKNGFGRLIDMARAEPVAIQKHGRRVVVVLAAEKYDRLVGGSVPTQLANLPTEGEA